MHQPNIGLAFSNAPAIECLTIVKFGKKYVGYTSAERENLIGTAVHPDYRNLGIATYMKAFDLKKQFDKGVEYIESSSANLAMLQVNLKLGYKFNGLTEIRMIKSL